MSKKEKDGAVQSIDSELAALKEQILSLAGIVESVFAESIIALIDTDSEAAHEAQLEDYRAHQVWLRADSLAVDLLSTGELRLQDVHMVCAMSHIALNLKRMADKGMKIANLINACPLNSLPSGICSDTLPRMTNITQTMFSNSIEAFINHDPAEANGLHPLYNEVHRTAVQLHEGVNEELQSQKNFPLEAGTALIVIGSCIEDIAEFALDNGTCIARLYPDNNHHNSNDLDGERE